MSEDSDMEESASDSRPAKRRFLTLLILTTRSRLTCIIDFYDSLLIKYLWPKEKSHGLEK